MDTYYRMAADIIGDHNGIPEMRDYTARETAKMVDLKQRRGEFFDLSPLASACLRVAGDVKEDVDLRRTALDALNLMVQSVRAVHEKCVSMDTAPGLSAAFGDRAQSESAVLKDICPEPVACLQMLVSIADNDVNPLELRSDAMKDYHACAKAFEAVLDYTPSSELATAATAAQRQVSTLLVKNNKAGQTPRI